MQGGLQGVEAANLAGEAIAVAHHDRVGLLAREGRQTARAQECGEQAGAQRKQLAKEKIQRGLRVETVSKPSARWSEPRARREAGLPQLHFASEGCSMIGKFEAI